MKPTPKITLNIDTLRVTGATQAEANVLASALRETLAAQLAADPLVQAGTNIERLKLSLPQQPYPGPAAIGQVAGQRIATSLKRGS